MGGVEKEMTKDLSFYKGKKVLITGHTGLKGSWMCRLLSNVGAVVTGYALNPPTDPSLFELAGVDANFCYWRYKALRNTQVII